MSDTVIKVQNVSKDFYIYRKNIQRIMGIFFGKEPPEIKHALKDVSFEVSKGEKVILIGVVESGRSTLENILSGIMFPTKGKVKTTGKINAMLNAKAGMDIEQTCIDNIYLKGNVAGLTPAKIKEIEDTVIERSGIEDYTTFALKRAPKNAPALMAMEIHIAAGGDLLFADETAFSGGGAPGRKQAEERLAEYLDENPEVTAVITTNSPEFGKAVGTRGIVLSEGEIAFDGPVEEAYAAFNAIAKPQTEEPEQEQEQESDN